jgi:beta-glucanase (GH16 family)
LKPDRGGWIETFSDDFASFSWFAGDLQDHQGERGTWRTQFGYAGPNSLGSRTLTSNRELQIYVDPAFRGSTTKSLGLNPFRVADGVLEIIADQATENIQKSIWGYTYTSGLITTRFSFSQLYGLFEIRARLPKGRGLWPTFWLLPVDGTWPPEIDILEVLGHDPTMLYTSLHSKSSGKHTSETIMTRISDSSADFHTYSVDWEEDEIRWYFDDIEIGRKATPSDMHKPMYLLANLAVGGKWPGRPDASTRFPAIFAIDWIHAYKRNQSK